MKFLKFIVFVSMLILFTEPLIYGQEQNISDNSVLSFGGYGSVDFSKELGNNVPAKLDVHRMVFTTEYSFSAKTRFFGELEFEHIFEVGVEQAWVEHKLNKFINFRSGLILIPMGIINEFHENNTFNGVERPLIDKYIVPTTWREIGAGLNGTFINAQLAYQFYIVNGFNGYDGSSHLSAKYPFRKGRQKGAESYMSSPNFSARIDYFALPKTKLGLSAYLGETQTTLSGTVPQTSIDSSKVGMLMLGADARINLKALQIRTQVYYVSLSNTTKYNYFAGLDAGNYLAKTIYGYYADLAYNVLNYSNSTSRLDVFVRYEQYNTQAQMEKDFLANASYNITDFTYGLSWKPSPKIAFKMDWQSLKNQKDNDWKHTFNLGLGFAF